MLEKTKYFNRTITTEAILKKKPKKRAASSLNCLELKSFG